MNRQHFCVDLIQTLCAFDVSVSLIDNHVEFQRAFTRQVLNDAQDETKPVYYTLVQLIN